MKNSPYPSSWILEPLDGYQTKRRNKQTIIDFSKPIKGTLSSEKSSQPAPPASNKRQKKTRVVKKPPSP